MPTPRDHETTRGLNSRTTTRRCAARRIREHLGSRVGPSRGGADQRRSPRPLRRLRRLGRLDRLKRLRAPGLLRPPGRRMRSTGRSATDHDPAPERIARARTLDGRGGDDRDTSVARVVTTTGRPLRGITTAISSEHPHPMRPADRTAAAGRARPLPCCAHQASRSCQQRVRSAGRSVDTGRARRTVRQILAERIDLQRRMDASLLSAVPTLSYYSCSSS